MAQVYLAIGRTIDAVNERITEIIVRQITKENIAFFEREFKTPIDLQVKHWLINERHFNENKVSFTPNQLVREFMLDQLEKIG